MRFHAEGTRLQHAGRVRDMGASGAFVEASRLPETGARIVLVMTAKTAWEPLALRAEVAWVREKDGARTGGFGCRFLAPSPSQARALDDLLRAHDDLGVFE